MPNLEAAKEEVRSEVGVWVFHVGIHSGTFTSRDIARPENKTSLEECEAEAQLAKRQYAELGSQIWFCHAISPSGKRITLLPGEPYR